jgi:hypothetical protein
VYYNRDKSKATAVQYLFVSSIRHECGRAWCTRLIIHSLDETFLFIWNHSRESRDALGPKEISLVQHGVSISFLMEIQLCPLSTRLAVWLAQTVEHCCSTPFHKIQRPSSTAEPRGDKQTPQVVRSNPIMSSPNHEKWATCCPCEIIMDSFVQQRNHLAS